MKSSSNKTTISNAATKTTTKVVAMPMSKRVFGRFNTDVENIHGRIAMMGITLGSLNELTTQIKEGLAPTMYEQLVDDTQFVVESVTKSPNHIPIHVSSAGVTATLVFITSFFIIQALGDTKAKYEDELEVFSKPGFTRESEILNGRIAMLVAMYILLSEQIYHHLLIA